MKDSAAAILSMPVPKSKGAVPMAIVVTSLILFITFLAIYNLFTGVGIIPPILWLLLVGTVVVGTIKTKGLKQSAIELLGAFSFREFVQTVRLEGGQIEAQFGYQLFGRSFVHLRIPVERIHHVNWSTGQASYRAGRDVNDWSVAIWYDHGDPVRSEKSKGWRYADQDIHIVGPSGSKEETTALGLLILDFLRQSGTDLVKDENDCTFVRQPKAVG